MRSSHSSMAKAGTERTMYRIKLDLVNEARKMRRRKIRYKALTTRAMKCVRLKVVALRIACCLIAFYKLISEILRM